MSRRGMALASGWRRGLSMGGLQRDRDEWYSAIRSILLPFASQATIFVDVTTGLSAVTLASGDASEVENLGAGGNFTQAVEANRPTFSADCFGPGRGGLLGNANDYMTAPDIAIANYTARTMLMLVKAPSTPTACRFFAHGSRSGANDATRFSVDSSGKPTAAISTNGSTVGTAADISTYSGDAIDDSPHVIAAEWAAGSRLRLWVDGIEDATPTQGGAVKATVFDTAKPFGLMSDGGGNNPIEAGAAIGIAISLPRVLTSTEMAAVQGALLMAGGLA